MSKISLYTSITLVAAGLAISVSVGRTSVTQVPANNGIAPPPRAVMPIEPVRYVLSPQQILRYNVSYTVKTRASDEAYREDYSIAGVLEVKVASVQEDGRYLLDLCTSVISARARKERGPIVVDKKERVNIKCTLGPRGGLDFGQEGPDHALKASSSPDAHARILRAADVVFPTLPSGWSGSAVAGGTYRYNCIGPILIQARAGAGSPLEKEAVSEFSGGMVRTGYSRYWRYTDGDLVVYCEMPVSIVLSPNEQAQPPD